MRRRDVSLVEYLKTITGTPFSMDPVPEGTTDALPLYLRQRYHFNRADFFGRRCFLAIEQAPPEAPSPTNYAREVEILKQRLSGDVVLVLPTLPPYFRNRLVHQCVPFIVPGNQMFLPMLMIDLREHSPRRTRTETALSPVAQVVLIFHLLRQPITEMSLREVAARLGYSAVTIGKAQDELVAAKLGRLRSVRRALHLQFNYSGRELWHHAEPLLSSPVRKEEWIQSKTIKAHAVFAGITALSQYSMLADETVPTLAMHYRDVVALRKGDLHVCGDREEADARLELWKYDPWLVAEGDKADRLSLYLSLRNSADERVQKELESLIAAVH